MSDDASLFDRLRHLAAFELSVNDTPIDAQDAQTPIRLETENGAIVLPSRRLTNTEEGFMEMAYRDKWIMPNFGWLDWSQSERGHALLAQPTAIARASELELAQIITILVRRERLCEGTLAEAFGSGLVSAAVERAKALCRNDRRHSLRSN